VTAAARRPTSARPFQGRRVAQVADGEPDTEIAKRRRDCRFGTRPHETPHLLTGVDEPTRAATTPVTGTAGF